MAVTLPTYGEQLNEVLSAISAVHVSQRYEINGRMMQKADLQWLHQERKYLEEQIHKFGDVRIGSTITRGSAQVSFGVSE